MAVVALKSDVITKSDATPQQKNPAYLTQGVIRDLCGYVSVGNGDDIGSTYRMVRIHSSWRPVQLSRFCTAITSGAMDIGIYDTAENGGAVVDADLFASAISIASALLNESNILLESGVVTLNEIGTRFWEMMGLSADPGKHYDVVFTLTAATTASGTMAARLTYVEN